MKKVITYGTFDLLHIGHINILRRAKELGDYLIVGVSSDEFNNQKGKASYYSLEERLEIVKAIRYVDEVIVENDWDQKFSDIEKHGISCLVMGSDWEGKFDELSNSCEVVYLPRTSNISTTKIRYDLSQE